MSNAAAPLRMTATEYLAWEREQLERHHFVRGEIFCMAGGTPRHNALTAAIAGEFRQALSALPCHVLSTDQRVVVLEGEHYVYPDVSVFCGAMELAPGTKDTLANPCIIVEVLSKSTEAYDRGSKWDGYRQIPSLTDYILVQQGAAKLEHFQRKADGDWTYRVIEAGGRLTLSNGPSIAIDAVYRGLFALPGE